MGWKLRGNPTPTTRSDVDAKETYDGAPNDISGPHVREEYVVLVALNDAKRGPVAEGNTGGYTGMVCYELKGGTGTSYRHVERKGGDLRNRRMLTAEDMATLKPEGLVCKTLDAEVVKSLVRRAGKTWEGLDQRISK